jgi:catechol 2,3-dioxygenase-like lactoylglutathione lyase family enzyme
MRFEHFALNVPDPAAMAAWYVRHLGMRVIRKMSRSPHTHFLADGTGRTVIEIYSNPAAPVPDYAAQDPLVLHWALASDDPEADARRLVEAGATRVKDEPLPDGSLLIMLRDPWSVPIQLCRRARDLP